jgi:hypothetical protein
MTQIMPPPEIVRLMRSLKQVFEELHLKRQYTGTDSITSTHAIGVHLPLNQYITD